MSKKYALISVSDKKGLIPFAQRLSEKGYGLIASGGTYQVLKEKNLEVLKVESITNSPEMLGGRVKTLHPSIHGSILYQRDNEAHLNDKEAYQLMDIALVVCNLYPFEEVLRKDKKETELIENIDIGGPTLLRASAKNYRDVCVVVDPKDYETVLEKMEDITFRKQMAFKAFSHTAAYDALISNAFSIMLDDVFPEVLTQTFRKKQDLRYGENPHQNAAYYERVDPYENIPMTQIHGKALSYNNINDLSGALKTLALYRRPTAVALKHANACGIASADSIQEAYTQCFESDPVSIFGGIVALNDTVDASLAQALSKTFLEIVLAPSFSEEALEILQKKKNIRLIEIKDMHESRPFMTKDVLNGILIQDVDALDYEALEVVSHRKPTNQEMDDLLFSWKSVRTIDSNAIVIARNEATLALGHGEVRRVWALEKAIQRSLKEVEGSVMASDGFFFEDTVALCAKHGIRAIIQPGGSIKDPKVIAACNEHDIALVFTKTRHFKH